MTEESGFDRTYWEDRYAQPELAWSGDPNPVLVQEAEGLRPGSAVDIGSGEGGDAIWLATRGWRVTGIDLAVNALEKARGRAERIDPVAASRITWEQHDIVDWAPAACSFDLVSSQFLHLAEPQRGTVFRALASAVAPGGTLLIVGHDIVGDTGEHHQHLRELMFGVNEVLAAIEDEHLQIDIAESRPREHGAAGSVTPLRDIVVRATRRNDDRLPTG